MEQLKNIKIHVISVSNKVTNICCYYSGLLPTFIIKGIGKFSEFCENIKVFFFFLIQVQGLPKFYPQIPCGVGVGRVQEPQVKKWWCLTISKSVTVDEFA